MKTTSSAAVTVRLCLLLLGALACYGQPANTTYSVGGLNYVSYDSYYSQKLTAKSIQTGCTSGSPKIPLVETTIATVHAAFLNGTLTCTDLVSSYVQRITAYNPQLNAISFINPNLVNDATQKDTALKAYIANGTALPSLFCVPIIAKDNYDALDTPTTAGAVAFLDNFPTADSTVIAKLKAKGAILLAKGTMSEWAQSAVHSIGSQFGVVRNPYGLARTTGGSSGGPASATAANLGLICVGSDTGSSIRTPAAFQSLVGIRPTIGLISRKGVVPLDYYRDSCGPLGRTVEDVALVFEALPGKDPQDGLTGLIDEFNVTLYDNYTQFLRADGLEGKKIGVWTQLATRKGYDPEIYAIFEQAAADMEMGGAELVYNVTLKGNSLGDKDWSPEPNSPTQSINGGFQQWYTGYGANGKWESLGGSCSGFKDAMEVYMATAGTKYKKFSEIYYDGLIHPTSVGAFSGDLNSYNHSASYPPAGSNLVCKCTAFNSDPCQGEYAKRFTEMLDDNDLDVVIYPVHGNVPPVIGNFSPDFIRNTYLAPQTGTPAITVPMGFTKAGLPVGLMISARHFDEPTLFMVAYAYEQLTKHRRTTPLFPECTDGAPYVPYGQVLKGSSDTPSPSGQPAFETLPSMRKLLSE